MNNTTTRTVPAMPTMPTMPTTKKYRTISESHSDSKGLDSEKIAGDLWKAFDDKNGNLTDVSGVDFSCFKVKVYEKDNKYLLGVLLDEKKLETQRTSTPSNAMTNDKYNELVGKYNAVTAGITSAFLDDKIISNNDVNNLAQCTLSRKTVVSNISLPLGGSRTQAEYHAFPVVSEFDPNAKKTELVIYDASSIEFSGKSGIVEKAYQDISKSSPKVNIHQKNKNSKLKQPMESPSKKTKAYRRTCEDGSVLLGFGAIEDKEVTALSQIYLSNKWMKDHEKNDNVTNDKQLIFDASMSSSNPKAREFANEIIANASLEANIYKYQTSDETKELEDLKSKGGKEDEIKNLKRKHEKAKCGKEGASPHTQLKTLSNLLNRLEIKSKLSDGFQEWKTSNVPTEKERIVNETADFYLSGSVALRQYAVTTNLSEDNKNLSSNSDRGGFHAGPNDSIDLNENIQKSIMTSLGVQVDPNNSQNVTATTSNKNGIVSMVDDQFRKEVAESFLKKMIEAQKQAQNGLPAVTQQNFTVGLTRNGGAVNAINNIITQGPGNTTLGRSRTI